MKKSEVKVKGHYKCRVSGRLVTVEIKSITQAGHFHAVNLATGRDIWLRSARRLQSEVTNDSTRN